MTLSFQTKVTGPMVLAKHFAPRMPADGSFVLFSGATARKPTVGMLAVGATNAAADAVARTLARCRPVAVPIRAGEPDGEPPGRRGRPRADR